MDWGIRVNSSRSRAGLISALAAAGIVIAGVLTLPSVASAASTSDALPTDGVSIPAIHGDTFLSPYNGKQVTNVAGEVTAAITTGKGMGFWFQDVSNANGTGSKGLFVYTGSTKPTVKPGDKVQVSGTVQDYYPDAAPAKSLDLPITELSKATWTVQSSGNALPKPLVLSSRLVPTTLAANDNGGDIENATLQPRKYALDFFKSHESELIQVNDARVIGPTDSYGELFVTDKPNQNPTPRGGTLYSGYDQGNTGRIEVIGTPGASTAPKANVGDTLSGSTVGPLTYSQYGGYEIEATSFGSLKSGGIKQEVTRKQRSNELAIATYNVQNLSTADDSSKFAKLADGIVKNLASPDIVSLEEIQDNDGPTDDGVVAADKTIKEFTDAIVAAGGPQYDYREIDPTNDADGGQPGGNIRNVLIFNPKRVSFVDVAGGTATTAVTVSGKSGHATLSASPGRIDPGNSAWQSSRKPLVGEFKFHGQDVFVISNHFDAKLGDQPTEGRYQPPARSSETQRQQQATLVHDFTQKIEKIEPKANIVALGDLNDYQFSSALHELTSGGVLNDLITTLPTDEQYTYVYEGNSEILDHILASDSVRNPNYDSVHINAEFSDQTSDHDPQILRFTPGA
ncbi:MAG: endonuclease/exonuclease/phosphatase family protein [Sciscionella sp.]|nr:endonuclease/exonuclease/phosphatase family protein [Sciscionella sp.]